MSKATKEVLKNSSPIDRNIEDFFSTEYLQYARYVLEERAIPSVIDGLKPSARKILFAALTSLSTKKQKMLNLVGETIKKSAYQHGNTSLESGIVRLGNKFNEILAPLEIVGQGGTLRDQSSAAPRYLSVKLSESSKLYTKDSEILEFNYDGDDRIEPKYYLPVIPMLLTKRDSGIALGYSFAATCSYNPTDIVNACIEVLKTGSVKKTVLRPYVDEYKGNWMIHDNRVHSIGKYTLHKNKVVINEFSVNQSYSSIEKQLNSLQDAKRILSWEDNSKDDNTEYVVHFNASVLKDLVDRNRIEDILMIKETIKKPNYTVLDEHGKVRKFHSPEDLLTYFTKFRLLKYEELKTVNIASIKKRIAEADYIRMFIDMYLKGTIKLNKDVSIETVKAILSKHNIPHSVLTIAVSRLTKEEYDKLTNTIAKLKSELAYIESTPVEQMYLDDLNDLKKLFSNKYEDQKLLTSPKK